MPLPVQAPWRDGLLDSGGSSSTSIGAHAAISLQSILTSLKECQACCLQLPTQTRSIVKGQDGACRLSASYQMFISFAYQMSLFAILVELAIEQGVPAQQQAGISICKLPCLLMICSWPCWTTTCDTDAWAVRQRLGSPARLDLDAPVSGEVGVRLRQNQVSSHVVCTPSSCQPHATLERSSDIRPQTCNVYRPIWLNRV